MATDGTGERSATFALPACHASSTADIYVFTVGLFYRGLEQTHKESNPWKNTAMDKSRFNSNILTNVNLCNSAITVTWDRFSLPCKVKKWKFCFWSSFCLFLPSCEMSWGLLAFLCRTSEIFSALTLVKRGILSPGLTPEYLVLKKHHQAYV